MNTRNKIGMTCGLSDKFLIFNCNWYKYFTYEYDIAYFKQLPIKIKILKALV